LRLVLDIDRSIDGRLEGFVQLVGAQAPKPFSGVLELVATVEELLLDSDAPYGLSDPTGVQAGRSEH